jgi:TadE-like protein
MVRKRMKRARVGEQGQALVELAFVIPLVLLFLFGIIDFGLALNQQNSDTNLANIAVREAAVVGTTSSVPCSGTTPAPTNLTAWVTCEAAVTGAPTPTYICVADTASTPGSADYTAGDPIKVEIHSTFNWLKLITNSVSSVNSTIGASATMRLEQGPATAGTTIPFFSGTTVCPS